MQCVARPKGSRSDNTEVLGAVRLGAAVGKSAAMPLQPDLESRPEVLDGLIKMIRSFGAH